MCVGGVVIIFTHHFFSTKALNLKYSKFRSFLEYRLYFTKHYFLFTFGSVTHRINVFLTGKGIPHHSTLGH